MEKPMPDLFDFEQMMGANQPFKRDPLHRTQRFIHTTDHDLRRDLQRIREQAEFDEAGYLNHLIDEEVLCLDCDCNFARTMAGQCLFCSPPARLCPEHFFHCAKCGRGICNAHATIILDPTTQTQKFYCPRHRGWIRTKRFLRGTVLAFLEPVVSYDSKTGS